MYKIEACLGEPNKEHSWYTLNGVYSTHAAALRRIRQLYEEKSQVLRVVPTELNRYPELFQA